MRPLILNCMAAALLVSVSAFVRAADDQAKTLNDSDAKKAAALIADLGADDFQTRENAEKGLNALGPAVLPLVKETAGSTGDAEVRTRCEHVVKALALDAENDPEQLAKLAKAEAEAKRYADAGKFYAKAGRIFKEQAEKSSDEKAKKDLVAKAAKASERQQRAEGMAKAEAGAEGQQVLVNGGRVRIIRAQGNVVVSSSMSVGEGGDW
jgi:colicin import membrane protein